MNPKIKKLYKELHQKDNIIVSYIGTINEDKLEDIFNEIEQKINSFSLQIKRKIFFISIELLQNIYHHSLLEANEKDKVCFFVLSISNDKKQIKISSGNLTSKKQYDEITNRIDKLNLLSKKDIKDLYKKILSNNKFSEKGGGGLGLIDIRRKSGFPIKYNKIILNKNLYFFNFFILLENKI